MQKIRDEGTSEPFMARMWLGILELVDSALGFEDKKTEKREDFHELYRPVLENLELARGAAIKILETIEEHRKNAQTGSIVSRQPAGFLLDESIDQEIRQQFSQFLNSGNRSLRFLQPLLEWFGVSIGHLFQKESKFRVGQNALRVNGREELAQYLDHSRKCWTEAFANLRNNHEHSSSRIDDFQYDYQGLTARLIEPQVCGVSVSQYSSETARKMWVFVEELIVYSSMAKFPHDVNIEEIPEKERDPGFAKRFKITLAGNPENAWKLWP